MLNNNFRFLVQYTINTFFKIYFVHNGAGRGGNVKTEMVNIPGQNGNGIEK